MTEPARVAESEALPLRLNWRQADREADYVADANGYDGSVGRIYLRSDGPQQGLWFWAMNAHGSEISRNIGSLNGVEKSARAAARRVEGAWFAAIAGSSLDQSAPKRNAYATARAGE